MRFLDLTSSSVLGCIRSKRRSGLERKSCSARIGLRCRGVLMLPLSSFTAVLRISQHAWAEWSKGGRRITGWILWRMLLICPDPLSPYLSTKVLKTDALAGYLPIEVWTCLALRACSTG